MYKNISWKNILLKKENFVRRNIKWFFSAIIEELIVKQNNGHGCYFERLCNNIEQFEVQLCFTCVQQCLFWKTFFTSIILVVCLPIKLWQYVTEIVLTKIMKIVYRQIYIYFKYKFLQNVEDNLVTEWTLTVMDCMLIKKKINNWEWQNFIIQLINCKHTHRSLIICYAFIMGFYMLYDLFQWIFHGHCVCI